MKSSASVVVVGAGIVGCAIAYNLALRGVHDVVLVEKQFCAAGSTGRCAAGVRKQFGTVVNCRLSDASIRILETLNEDLGYQHDIEFKQKGYLILAYTEKEYSQFEKNVCLQNELGIPSVFLTAEDARQIVPHLNTDGLLAATYCAEDGHCNPFQTTLAYADAAKKLGVDIQTYTTVTGIETRNGAITAVLTDKGRIETGKVVNAAGPYAQFIAKMAGLEVPNYAERHQILVTEPVEQVQAPMVLSFSRRFYCQQTPHGSFMMGVADPSEPRTNDLGHSWQFLDEVATRVCTVLPPMRRVRAIRQWSGSYDMTPDSQPILGRVPQLEGFYMAAGYSGHGFMMGPITGELIADLMVGKEPSIDISMLDLGRFERGELVFEPSVV